MSRVPRSSAPPRQDTRAVDLLDSDHPFSRADARLTLAGERCVVVAAMLAAGVVALVDGLSIGAPLTVAAALVLTAQLVQVGVLSDARNRRAVELIAQGRGEVPIEAVERVRRRLLRPGHRARLARALDEIRAEIERPRAGACFARPLYCVRVLRPVVSEITEVAALVRGEGGVRGVARTEQLITDGRSPLYGDGEELLRQELARIRFLLASERSRPNDERGDRHAQAARAASP